MKPWFYDPAEVAAVDALVARLVEDGREPTSDELNLLSKTRAIDIGMFGRMLADAHSFDTDAAVQVAHAFTVHAAQVEEDYYTAMDDATDDRLDFFAAADGLSGERTRDDAGASHLDTAEFGAGTFYLYVCVDAASLVRNVGSADLARSAIQTLAEAAATVAPAASRTATPRAPTLATSWPRQATANRARSCLPSLSPSRAATRSPPPSRRSPRLVAGWTAPTTAATAWPPKPWMSTRAKARSARSSTSSPPTSPRLPMPNPFLLLTLAGPMAAWGDVAVGESRPAYARPSKSGVFGLVAAALGLARDDENGHRALRQGTGFAVWPTVPGHLLLDYHTAQAPTGKAGRGLSTRRAELAHPTLNTTLSTRAYRTDARAVVALWTRADVGWSLGDIQEALRTPAYPLYLGRRACPPSEPLDPRIVHTESLPDAFAAYQASSVGYTATRPPARVAFSDPGAPGLPSDLDAVTRRDDPIHRGRRAFADRLEVRFDVPRQ